MLGSADSVSLQHFLWILLFLEVLLEKRKKKKGGRHPYHSSGHLSVSFLYFFWEVLGSTTIEPATL